MHMKWILSCHNIVYYHHLFLIFFVITHSFSALHYPALPYPLPCPLSCPALPCYALKCTALLYYALLYPFIFSITSRPLPPSFLLSPVSFPIPWLILCFPLSHFYQSLLPPFLFYFSLSKLIHFLLRWDTLQYRIRTRRISFLCLKFLSWQCHTLLRCMHINMSEWHCFSLFVIHSLFLLFIVYIIFSFTIFNLL